MGSTYAYVHGRRNTSSGHLDCVTAVRAGRPSRSAYLEGALFAIGVLFMCCSTAFFSPSSTSFWCSMGAGPPIIKWAVGQGYFLQIPQHPTNSDPLGLVRTSARNWLCLTNTIQLEHVQAGPYVVMPPFPVEIPPPLSPAWLPETATAPRNLNGGGHTTNRVGVGRGFGQIVRRKNKWSRRAGDRPSRSTIRADA